jgi:hypothetical protein
MQRVILGALVIATAISQAQADCSHHTISFSDDRASAEAELARTIQSLDGDEASEAWGMLRALAAGGSGGTGSDEGTPGLPHQETATD